MTSSTAKAAPTDSIVRFKARDGYPLSGTLTRPAGTPKGGILVTSGTGFPQHFYRPFCLAAAARGFAVLRFDARGIGASAPTDLAALDMQYTDWGRHDTPAALDYLKSQTPTGAIAHVAHSVGGHFVGLWDNFDLVDAHAFVCVGSGYWRDHKIFSRLTELYFWNVLGPRSLRRHGFVKKGGGWTGEALPRGVFETWRRWCAKPDYFADEIGRQGALADVAFDRVEASIRSYIYTDDPIATPKTAQAMLDLYPSAPREMIVRSPQDFGLSKIGHAGPFGKNGGGARDEIIDWVGAQLSESTG